MKKLLAVLLLCAGLSAHAWEPTKPVTVIIGNTPGAGNEMAFRKLAEIVQKTNPRFVYVVQNIPGADSVIANNKFMTEPADGYTINLPSHMSSSVTNDIWDKSIKTPEQFIKYIATTKTPINIAVGGGAHRTAFEYLMDRGRGNKDLVRPIKFNGPVPAVQSVAQYDGKTGTEFGIMPIAVARPLVEAGKVVPIGFTGNRVMPQFPNVPLLRDVAPGINVYAAWSIQLPPNTPADVTAWYQRSFSEAVRSEEYQEWRRANVVFYEESELTPAGLKRHMDELRASFIPVLSRIDLSKE